jgi:hypothetical protein
MGYSWVVKFWVALMVYIVCNKICLIQGGGALHRGEGKGRGLRAKAPTVRTNVESSNATISTLLIWTMEGFRI